MFIVFLKVLITQSKNWTEKLRSQSCFFNINDYAIYTFVNLQKQTIWNRAKEHNSHICFPTQLMWVNHKLFCQIQWSVLLTLCGPMCQNCIQYSCKKLVMEFLSNCTTWSTSGDPFCSVWFHSLQWPPLRIICISMYAEMWVHLILKLVATTATSAVYHWVFDVLECGSPPDLVFHDTVPWHRDWNKLLCKGCFHFIKCWHVSLSY